MSEALGFIGCGRMAQAMVGGVLKAALFPPTAIIASDPSEGCREHVAKLGVTATGNNGAVFSRARAVVLAVKPGMVNSVLDAALAQDPDSLGASKLIISIAAGVPIAAIEHRLREARVVRVMPNTPCLVGAAASAFALGTRATPEDAEFVQRLLDSCGLAFQVKEPLLDAVTGLSGSGPAYGFLSIEAMADGGVRAGLPRSIALKLAAQTMLGAAKLVLETGKHPGELKDMVCSPGGTTIAGVHELERGGLRAAFINAVEAAATRSAELGLLS